MKELLNAKGGQLELLLGNEAIARGALEAGVAMVCCYPGTPSSEVADTLYFLRSQCLEAGEAATFRVEYSVNEKVAMEVACGAALGGARSLATMKHVGLNVAADPLFTAAYIGLPGGLVVLSADDPGCHSSQNEQDNRQYARFANLPCFEPASAQEAKDMTKAAFQMAVHLEQPVLLRSTTRVSHMRGPVELAPLPDSSRRADFQRAPDRFVPVPAVARKRHVILCEAMAKAAEMAEKSRFNKVFLPEGLAGKAEFGVIASGIARDYLADALLESGLQDRVAVLELGLTWPLPQRLIVDFLRKCGKVLVLEEGAPLLEKDVRALAQESGVEAAIEGKDAMLTEIGEYSASLVIARLARWLGTAPRQAQAPGTSRKLPGRPPNLCPGCSHRAVYYAVRRVFGDDAVYSSDIGCYTLGLLPPLRTADFLVCMGSSVSAGSGLSRATGRQVVGFIGDSTFFHSGMTGIANAVFNRHDLLLIVLDNGTTAMTGHQPNPGMRQDILGQNAARLDMESIARALGAAHVAKVKATNLAAVTRELERLRHEKGVRVLIAEEPCVLYARRGLKRKKSRVARVISQGAEAERCFKELACPAFSRVNGELSVDENLCSGCMLCLQAAPGAFGSRKC